MTWGISWRLGAVAASVLCFAAPVRAQPAERVPPPLESPLEETLREQAAVIGTDVETLDRYAESLAAIRRIQVRAAAEISGIVDEQKSYDIEQRAKQEMIEAVLQTGISVEEYQRVSRFMNALPEMREAIMQRVMQWLGEA